MKILHVSDENKFIDLALLTFERLYPKKNTTLYLSSKKKILKNNTPSLSFSKWSFLKPAFYSNLKKYDLIIFHNFGSIEYWMLANMFSKNQKLAWIGWGYDYIDYIYTNTEDLLLDESKKFYRKYLMEKKTLPKIIKKYIKKLAKASSIKKIHSFSPVIENEYDLIKKSKELKNFPDFVPWNYSSEKYSEFMNPKSTQIGSKILIGNSASITNNHFETFKILKKINENKKNKLEVLCPLNYGDAYYAKKVREIGKNSFGDMFQSIDNFLDRKEYFLKLKDCGYVIMNHVRQQAVGNIISALYQGSRVFLNEKSPVLSFLQKEGAFVNEINELIEKPYLIEKPLSDDEKKNNRSVVLKHWSRKAIDTKTKKLVEYHL